MSLLNFFKKKKQAPEQNNILLAMPIFKDGNRYLLNDIVEKLKKFWHLNVTDIQGDNEAASFNINGETIAFAYVDAQIPRNDIEGTAKYAYNWPSALQELENHTGHAIVSIMSSKTNIADRFRILSKVLSSILMTSEAVAIYQGSQSLLIPRQQYLDHNDELKQNGCPVMLWVYIGLMKLKTGNSAYTYGLKDFGKEEMEIVDSKLSLEELYELLFNITSYVIGSNITLRSGETLGHTAEQTISIKASHGQFVEGDSLKLEI